MAPVKKTCSIASKSPAASPMIVWLCSDVFTASRTQLIYMLALLLIPPQLEMSQLAMLGSTHTAPGLSVRPSSANTQLPPPSRLNAAKPAAQGNHVMAARGTDINPVVTTSHNEPNIFSISRNLSTPIARRYISERSLYTYPVLIPFLKYSLCRETGSHGRWIFGFVQCTRFYVLSTGLSHTRGFSNLQRHKHHPTLFLQSCFLRVPPSLNGHEHSHSRFCSNSTFSQQSSPKILKGTSRVTRDNGSPTPSNSKIATGPLMGQMPTDKYPFCREVNRRRGSTFAWDEQLLHALERCRRSFSVHGVLLLVWGHSLLPLKETCGLKTQPRLSPCLQHVPRHK